MAAAAALLADRIGHALVEVMLVLLVIFVIAIPLAGPYQEPQRPTGLVSAPFQSITIITPTDGSAYNATDAIFINYSSTGVDHYELWWTTNSSLSCNAALGSANGWTLLQSHPYFSPDFNWTSGHDVNSSTMRIEVEGHNSGHGTIAQTCTGNFTIALPPSTPSGLTATMHNTTQINLSWSAASGLVSGYLLFRNDSQVANLTGSANTSYADGGLTPNTVYRYQVMAYNPVGQSASSPNVTRSTTDNPPTWSQNSTNSTTAGSPIKFSVKWQDDIGLSAFVFGFDNGTGSFVNDTSAPFTGTTNHSNVTKTINSTIGSTIRWRVYANDTAGGLNATDTFAFNATASTIIITFVSPTDSNATSVPRNWTMINATVSGEHDISVCRLEFDGANESMTLTGPGTSVYCSKNKTGVDGTYTYRVYANDTIGSLGSSETRQITLDTAPPSAVANLTNISRTSSSITWNWTNPSAVDFNRTVVFKDGTLLTNVSAPNHNVTFTGLAADTLYTISTWTVDNAGNVNNTFVNASAKTDVSGGGGGGGGSPSVTVTAPAGGSSFTPGSAVSITWTSSNVDHYQVCYTTSSGAACSATGGLSYCDSFGWTVLAAHPYSPASFSWTTPSTLSSSTVRVMVEGHNSSHYMLAVSCSGSFTVAPAAAGGGGGGGGGGATPTPTVTPTTAPTPTPTVTPTPTTLTEPRPLAELNKRIEVIEAGAQQTVPFIESQVDVTRITISAKARLAGVEATVKKYAEKPTAAPVAPGVAYSYLNISIRGATAADANVTARFSVNKSWVAQNNVSVSTIRLSHLSNSNWTKLPTTKVTEDATAHYFEARLSNFSYFAISGDKVTSAAPPAPVALPISPIVILLAAAGAAVFLVWRFRRREAAALIGRPI